MDQDGGDLSDEYFLWDNSSDEWRPFGLDINNTLVNVLLASLATDQLPVEGQQHDPAPMDPTPMADNVSAEDQRWIEDRIVSDEAHNLFSATKENSPPLGE